MVELRDKIRRTLRGTLTAAQIDSRYPRDFESEEALEAAVEKIYRRIEELQKLSSQLGSLEKAKLYLDSQSARRREQVFPQNNVSLKTLVFQPGANGLCPLPSRLDCLTGLCTTYPEVQPETDLSVQEVLAEPIAVDWPHQPVEASSSVSLKRLKVKPI